MSGYVIVGPRDELDGEQLYWSNEDGWVSRDSATTFTRAETDELDLPAGATHVCDGAATGLRFFPAGPLGEYRVELDGEQIGRVRRRETRYNLRRVVVSRWWEGIELDREVAGDRIPGAVVATGATRREVAERLAELYLQEAGR